jgi:hypothetical protein
MEPLRPPGGIEAHSGVKKAHRGAMEAHRGAMEAHSGAMEADCGVMEAHPGDKRLPGAMGAYPRAMEAHPRDFCWKNSLLAHMCLSDTVKICQVYFFFWKFDNNFIKLSSM